MSEDGPLCKYLAIALLRDLVNYKLKLEDAPCSAETHFDRAIFLLSEHCATLKNIDAEMIAVVNSAREHMVFYHKEAKEPWPHE